jgi:hypothetical protein
MNSRNPFCFRALLIATATLMASSTSTVSAAPTAEVAKRCLHYAYTVYPFKRPGAVSMSPDRQNYFKDCMSKNGEVPAPSPPSKNSDASPQKT